MLTLGNGPKRQDQLWRLQFRAPKARLVVCPLSVEYLCYSEKYLKPLQANSHRHCQLPIVLLWGLYFLRDLSCMPKDVSSLAPN